MVPGHWYTVPHYATDLPGCIVGFKMLKIWPEMPLKKGEGSKNALMLGWNFLDHNLPQHSQWNPAMIPKKRGSLFRQSTVNYSSRRVKEP